MNRPIHVRLILALTLAVSFSAIGLVANGQTHAKPKASPVAKIDPAAEIPTLPTVLVQAPAEIPTLPLVVVRADVDADSDHRSGSTETLASSGNPTIHLPDVLPHVRLDMPYYSFGKLIPRAIKE